MLQATIIGSGMAGSEAAWQLLRAGIHVDLIEARPAVQSPAHRTLLAAEMVCTNSLRSDADDTAPGLLKAEMRRIGSLLLDAADRHRVPAGSALAVDRWGFGWDVTARLLLDPNLSMHRHAVDAFPPGPTVLASGPLTSPGLSRQLTEHVGEGLYFYDAISPIIDADSIDTSKVFFGARHQPESDDYLNCPMDAEHYANFVEALRQAERVPPHPFEDERYFEGCLPVEEIARRGQDTLAFGPLRPIGLIDPRTGRRPFVAVQLRAENGLRTCYNIVGFQTRMTYGAQRRVFRMIPGLENADFLRLGSIHRNSYIDSPRLLGRRCELRSIPNVRIAGQMAGVEGYLESAAMGMVVGLLLAADLQDIAVDLPPHTTALGALIHHVLGLNTNVQKFTPSNITFGLMPPAEELSEKRRKRGKAERRQFVRNRAMQDLNGWLATLAPLNLRDENCTERV